jgi:hypothetical protein
VRNANVCSLLAILTDFAFRLLLQRVPGAANQMCEYFGTKHFGRIFHEKFGLGLRVGLGRLLSVPLAFPTGCLATQLSFYGIHESYDSTGVCRGIRVAAGHSTQLVGNQ